MLQPESVLKRSLQNQKIVIKNLNTVYCTNAYNMYNTYGMLHDEMLRQRNAQPGN